MDNHTSACLHFNVPMARHTSLGVGGPAGVLALPTSEAQLLGVLRWANAQDLPYLIVGAGTNLLVRDGGFEGLVVKMSQLRGAATVKKGSGKRWLIQAPAGVTLGALCNLSLRQGLAGLNFALGIPGSLGGAVRMNAGAQGSEIGNIVKRLRTMWSDGEIEEVAGERLQFDYRRLVWPVFRQTHPGRAQSPEVYDVGTGEHRPHLCPPVITAVTLELEPADQKELLVQARQIWGRRRVQQPLQSRSAGCFFKNPPAGPAAGWLIDAAGLKGHKVGDAQVSSRHANFIVNTGSASAEDILKLVEIVRDRVKSQFNVGLKNEVIVVGKA